MTQPIQFSCQSQLSLTPVEIADQILDLSKWPDFTGYGPLPGIEAAEFDIKTADVVGTKIRVTNADGSSHVEEIVVWDPPRRLQLHLTDFSPPLSRLATSFDETWELERHGDNTTVVRAFALHPTSNVTRPALWLIAQLLQKAVSRHLRQLAD